MKMQKTSSPFLADFEGAAAEIINPLGKAPIVLICEHASNFIPESLEGLGLDLEGRKSHAAWDIGAYELACKISQQLDAPLVASRITRLVYDCNRSPKSRDGIPSKSELIDVPGNRDLSNTDFNDRVKYVYEPFHKLISQVINEQRQVTTAKQESLPAIITIHSFTPVYFGEKRSVELGILHDKDDRLAKSMMAFAKQETQLITEFNSPYDASDNVMHTVNKHATEVGFLNVMLEVKNDLLSNASDINSMAKSLSSIIKKALLMTK
ncbi:MAG: N-formylglutamate amidohydrolase [Cocleimonas sp.]